MKTSAFTLIDSPQTLETFWRLKLEGVQDHYRFAADRYKELLKRLPNELSLNRLAALDVAGTEESQALAEYIRVLRIFTELIVHGKTPEEAVGQEIKQRPSVPSPNAISIIDDDESVRGAIRALLLSAGYDVATFASAALFLKSSAARDSACLILDLRMPGIDGLELQRRLNAAEFTVPIIFISAHDDPPNRRKAIEAGAVDFFASHSTGTPY